MDTRNRFHTNETWLWVRAEHLLLIGVLVVLLVLHWQEVSWPRFAAAFLLIDLIGYVPGAVVYRRSHGGRAVPMYHPLLKPTHRYATAGLAARVWAVTRRGAVVRP